MTDVLRVLLVVIVLFGIYRQCCVIQYWWHCRRASGKRFRGLRVVVNRGGRVARPAEASGLITPATTIGNQVRRLDSAPSRMNGHQFRSLGAAVNRDLFPSS